MAALVEDRGRGNNDAVLLSYCFHTHPKMAQLQSYGFPDENQLEITLLVYLDLAEDKGWWNVQIVPCEMLQMAAVVGHTQKSAERDIIVPVKCDASMSHEEMQQMTEAIKTEHGINGVILGMVEDDSSILYFRLTQGLIPPDPPEMLEFKKHQQKRKLQRRMKRYNQMTQEKKVPTYAKRT